MNKALKHLECLHRAAGVAAVNVLHLTAPVWPGDTVTIGGRVYQCDDHALPTFSPGNVGVHVFNGYANATLNFDDQVNVQDGNTVTVGDKTYTFKDVLTDVDGYVKIGPTIDRSIYNLVAAMNVGYPDLIDPPAIYGELNDVGEGRGVAYAASMARNPANVHALHEGDFAIIISHWPGGTEGNSIALDATLAGTGDWVEGNVVSPVQPPFAAQFSAALVAALNSDPAGPVFAEQINVNEVLVWSRRHGDVRLPCSASFSEEGNAWETATLLGGAVARDGLMPLAGIRRVITAMEVTQGRLHVVCAFSPVGALVQLRFGTGEHVAFDGIVEIQGRRVTIVASGAAFVAGQEVHLIAFN